VYIVIIVVLLPDRASITRVLFSVNNGTQETLADGQKIQVRESDNLLLICTVDANPLATVILIDKQDNLISKEYSTEYFIKEYRPVTCEQAGNYTLKASNVYNREIAKHTFGIEVFCTHYLF